MLLIEKTTQLALKMTENGKFIQLPLDIEVKKAPGTPPTSETLEGVDERARLRLKELEAEWDEGIKPYFADPDRKLMKMAETVRIDEFLEHFKNPLGIDWNPMDEGDFTEGTQIRDGEVVSFTSSD